MALRIIPNNSNNNNDSNGGGGFGGGGGGGDDDDDDKTMTMIGCSSVALVYLHLSLIHI